MQRQTSLVGAMWLGLSVAIGHGIGRFGYSLLMPAMQSQLHWGYNQASWINTANALGYVLGTITGVLLLRRLSGRRLFRAGIWVVVLSLPLMAVPAGFAWLLVLRVLSGLGAAWSFSTGGALVNEIYGDDARRKGVAVGLFFGCAGLGMVLTAAVVPGLIEQLGEGAWPLGWLALAAISLMLLALPLGMAKGDGDVSQSLAAADARVDLRMAWLPLVAYFGFAASHTGYIFFVFAWMRAQQMPWFHGAAMWMVLGIFIFASAWIWQRALATWQAQRTLALCCLACGVAAVLPAVRADIVTVCLSAALMGGSLFIGPASMAVLTRQILPAPVWGKALMLFSLVFALGQAFGSWAFGLAADAWQSLGAVLGLSSAGLLLSAAAALVSSMPQFRAGPSRMQSGPPPQRRQP